MGGGIKAKSNTRGDSLLFCRKSLMSTHARYFYEISPHPPPPYDSLLMVFCRRQPRAIGHFFFKTTDTRFYYMTANNFFFANITIHYHFPHSPLHRLTQPAVQAFAARCTMAHSPLLNSLIHRPANTKDFIEFRGEQ